MKKLTACTAQNRNATLKQKCAYWVCEKICKIFKLRITLNYSKQSPNTGDFHF